jgi:hypothetical protein
MTNGALPRLYGCQHRREFPAGENTVIAAPGWSIFIHTPKGDVRVDPESVDDLVEALQAAYRHQQGKNPK